MVVKRATGADADRLLAEAARLRQARHPGVVSLVHAEGDGEEYVLHLAHGGRPVGLAPPRDPASVARVVGRAAAITADLHEAGIVHGHLDPSHVLVGPHGKVRLCGLGPDAGGAQPCDDVAALGALLVELLGRHEELEPIPDRRWGRRRAWNGWTRRSLLLLADHATAEPPSRRPTARRLSAAIAEVAPAGARGRPASPAELPEGLDPEGPTAPVRASMAGARSALLRGSTLRGIAGASMGLIAFGWGALWLTSPSETAPAVAGDRTSSGDQPSAVCVRLRPSEGSGSAEVPCLEPVVVEGTQVRVGSQRFEVGSPGDRVVLGDWDCDGEATAAVLRPSTGSVFVFSGWAADDEIQVPPAASVSGAVALERRTGAEGCDSLLARRTDGSTHPVPAHGGRS